MSDPKDFPTRDEGPEEREVQRLLEEAGPRPEVSQQDLATIKTAFRAEWARQVEGDRPDGLDRMEARDEMDGVARMDTGDTGDRTGWRSGRLVLVASLAAGVLLAVGLGVWGGWHWLGSLGTGPGSGTAVARVEVLHGEAFLQEPTVEGGPSDGLPLAAGQGIPPGTELRTALDGLVALRLGTEAPHLSLRLDAGTRIRLVSPSEVELVEGALYVDTGAGDTDAGHREAPKIAVRTPLGTATDLGTQFEVRWLGGDPSPASVSGSAPGSAPGSMPGSVRIRVREGEVRLDRDDAAARAETATARAGEELTLHADGSLDRGRVDVSGDAWSWVLDTAPPFDIEGRSLRDFLAWVGRETGWRIRYGSAELAERADTITLHGSLTGVTPDQAPDVVLPGAGLSARRVDGTLVIEP